jgi:hypothetical protein
MRYFCFIILLIAFNFNGKLIAKKFIDNIFIERKEVFDSTDKDWFFAADLANSIHVLTKEYIIRDELLFAEGEEIDKDHIYETIRNLRNYGLFSKVSVALDSVSEYYYDIYLTTKDIWSTIPIFIFGTGGNTTNIGGGMEELNLAGTGTHLRGEIYHRNENHIGIQGGFFITQRRLFRSEFFLDAGITANRYRTDQALLLSKPFRTIETEWAYGLSVYNAYGRDFLYKDINAYELMPFHSRNLQVWFSRSWLKNDRVFFSALLDLNDVDRGNIYFERAFDNTGKLLFSFSSVSEEYLQTDKLNTYQKEDIPVGGWGAATLGKIFPIDKNAGSYYYLGLQGEKSYLIDNFYFFGQATGASAFSKGNGYFTYQEALVKSFYKFNPLMLIAARLRQQTVWNWDKLRQLILDNDGGLRGYQANQLSADNRIVINTEFRLFPDWQVWIFKLAGAAFWDIATVWDQETKLIKTQWHNSAGLGIRFYNQKSTGENSIFRLDFAFNFDKGKFGEIIFTTDQLFSVFERHRYKLPQLYGTEFDYQ